MMIREENGLTNFILVTYDNLNSLNGAAKFIAILEQDKEYWNSCGINVTTYSNSSSYEDEMKYVSSNRHKIKKTVKGFLKNTGFGNRILLKYYLSELGRKPVDSIIEAADDNTVFLLNDFAVAYNFYNKYRDSKKTIFMMHNNGNLMSMLDETFHGDKRCHKILQVLEKNILSFATKIVFVSKCGVNLFLETHPEYKHKCLYIYNGIDGETFDADRQYEYLHLVSVGSVCKRKNQISIIKAIDLIRDNSIELTLVGAGESLEECKKYSDSHGLDKQIHIVGAQNNVDKYLKEANCFILASVDEGLPISAQEAMRESLPLILTDVGGCSELIHKNGMLIEPTVDSIKKAIEQINTNKQLLITFGAESQKMFRKDFTSSVMRGHYAKLVKEMI